MDRQDQMGLFNVEVQAVHHLSFADLTPLLDGLTERLELDQPMFAFQVNATRNIFDPPAAGVNYAVVLSVLIDVAKEAAAIGGALGVGKFVATFMDEMAKDAWKSIRTRLAELARKGKQDECEWRFVPCAIVINGVRFVLSGEVSDEELVRRLRKAADYLRDLPDDAFGGSPGPGEFALKWDTESESWRGTTWALYRTREKL